MPGKARHPETAAPQAVPRLRVAALADVHGNAPALEAVLAEVEQEAPDLVVFCGDLTWGPLPEETIALARSVDARFVRGNADR
jgi:predicted phosphodiesterase